MDFDDDDWSRPEVVLYENVRSRSIRVAMYLSIGFIVGPGIMECLLSSMDGVPPRPMSITFPLGLILGMWGFVWVFITGFQTSSKGE